ncbi:helix-turn-helix transcriptional regulator [Microtetraspora fusca]|uniref:helix-turn-helix transcriptional regulator n=1 Tax=Microtetraspora fusca TaxID=1997 RepID=UPI000832F37E|nr:WYL domain-containing protein [Microtetraspora fusca]
MDHQDARDERREAVRRAIDRALLERQVLRIEYAGGRGETTTREVEPSVFLGGRGGVWYLVAWCRLRYDVRVFRLNRILSAEPTGERYPEPDTERLSRTRDAFGP